MMKPARMGLAEYFFTGQFEKALAWANKVLGENPDAHLALFVKAAAMAAADYPRAELQRIIQHLLTIVPGATIKSMRQRMQGYRQVDAESVEAALRKAALPE